MDRVDPRVPGADLLERGLADLRDGVESVPALLLAIGSPRLRVLVDGFPADVPQGAEKRLYRLLAQVEGDHAHAAYNAWIRRLIKLERALEHLRARSDRGPTPP